MAFGLSLILSGPIFVFLLLHEEPKRPTTTRGTPKPEPKPKPKPVARRSVRVEVNAKDFGKKWPLLVDRGFLRCEEFVFDRHPHDPMYVVSFETTDGTVYRTTSRGNWYPEADPIWMVERQHPELGPIKKDIAPLNWKGFELCKRIDPSLLENEW